MEYYRTPKKIESELTVRPDVAALLVKFWFDEQGQPPLITVEFCRWPEHERVCLANACEHWFCKPGSFSSPAKCSYSPTGLCNPRDATPGSQAEWMGEFTKLKTLWGLSDWERIGLLFDVMRIEVAIGADGRMDILKNLNALNRVQFKTDKGEPK